MIARFFARSLKNAHRRWQNLEAELVASRHDLARKLGAAKMAAQAAGVDSPEQEGILEEAHKFTDAPVHQKFLNAHNAISNVFAVLGTGLWRTAPPSLQSTLNTYENLLTEAHQASAALGKRLHTICTILDTLNQHPEYAPDLSPRLVLRHPEIAEALLQLGKELWESRKVCLNRLQRGFHNRVDLGLGWLRVLQPKMKPFKHSRAKLNLGATRAQAPPEAGRDLNPWLILHQRLDQQLQPLNRLAVDSLCKDDRDAKV